VVKNAQDPQNQSPESDSSPTMQQGPPQATVDLLEVQRIIGDLALTLASERTRATKAERAVQSLIREREALIARIRDLESRARR
jgi:hypothetical protein